MRTVCWMLTMLACGVDHVDREQSTPSEENDTGAIQSSTSSTSSSGSEPSDVARCEPTGNSQVFTCTVALPSAGPVTMTLSSERSPDRIFVSTERVTTHVFYVWGLLPDTTYRWDAGVASGQLSTGSLPLELAELNLTVEGDLFGMDAVLIYVSCGWFVMVDSEGRVIWHQDAGLYDYIADGMRWSQEEKAMLTLQDKPFTRGSSSAVMMRDLAGYERLYLDESHLALRSTHDLDVWNGYLYVLGNEPAGFHFSQGGVEIFDGTTRIAQWMISDAFPDVDGLNNDHLNTLSVNEGGEMTLSVYSRTAVLGVDGDPLSSTFLQSRYHALGSLTQLNALPEPDYVPTSGTLFLQPHNPNRVGDTLWVFDNGSQLNSRAVQMSMNDDGTLTELQAFSAYAQCPHQSGAIPVAGGVLVTCSATNSVYLYRDQAVEPQWSMQATCGDVLRSTQGSVRGYPVLVD